jgi:hypothetical protein
MDLWHKEIPTSLKVKMETANKGPVIILDSGVEIIA